MVQRDNFHVMPELPECYRRVTITLWRCYVKGDKYETGPFFLKFKQIQGEKDENYQKRYRFKLKSELHPAGENVVFHISSKTC